MEDLQKESLNPSPPTPLQQVGEVSKELIDLRGVKCPLNFVKAKLALEKLPENETLKIILDLGEPAETVPKSLLTEGYQIIEEKTEDNFFVLLVLNKNKYGN